ncbi:MAG: thiamine pyrophosphate-binding protein [Chloroflexota bacterium]
MNGAQVLVEMLIRYETQVVFGLPGDTTIALYDALYAESKRITHVMARDERSAAFMADVYARLTGKPGICEGPSGGGATYMLPGIAEAHGSSVPLIALTSDNPIAYEAQGALTALDQPRLYEAVTKWTTLVKRADALPHLLRRAFRLATSGRPGAVHLGLPKDILSQEISADVSLGVEDTCKLSPSHRTRPSPDAVSRAARKLAQAARPVIVAGGGAVASGAYAELLALAQHLNAPVATTINGKGAIAETSRHALGVIGGNGARPYANQIVQDADLVLFIGSKVNYVDTDNWRAPSLAKPPTIVQIDVDPGEIGNNYPIAEGLCGDAKLALADLLDALKEICPTPIERGSWFDEIARAKAEWLAALDQADDPKQMTPHRIFRELRRALPEETIIVCDPGTPTPYLAAEFELSRAGRYVIDPRAHGGLGYAIPGVVGARLAKPDAPIVGLCGDGSFAISAGDLATITRVGGPTILILFNNGSYGWIKALQKLHHGSRYFSVDFTEPLDYKQIAAGFGLRVLPVNTPEEIVPAIQRALSCSAPCFIELVTPGEHEVIPPVAAWQRMANASE